MYRVSFDVGGKQWFVVKTTPAGAVLVSYAQADHALHVDAALLEKMQAVDAKRKEPRGFLVEEIPAA